MVVCLHIHPFKSRLGQAQFTTYTHLKEIAVKFQEAMCDIELICILSTCVLSKLIEK
jgi:hypothetical protein